MEEATKIENVNEDLQNQSKEPLAEDEGSVEAEAEAGVDYGEIVRQDVAALSAEFSELRELTDITELENPIRYAALRDLGLTPAEAYLATTKSRRKADNRSHLFAMPMVSSAPAGSMSERELEVAREIFTDISDAQIKKLYKKVTR